jgi:hypothetical protein
MQLSTSTDPGSGDAASDVRWVTRGGTTAEGLAQALKCRHSIGPARIVRIVKLPWLTTGSLIRAMMTYSIGAIIHPNVLVEFTHETVREREARNAAGAATTVIQTLMHLCTISIGLLLLLQVP